MKQAIEKYILENDVINICLSFQQNSEINSSTIYLNYLEQENSDLIQKIILSGKHISVTFYYQLDSHKDVYILSYANEIKIHINIPSKIIVDLISPSINLQKLALTSSSISEINIKNKLNEKKFLKYIKIMFSTHVNINDIFDIMEIKTLDTLHLYDYVSFNIEYNLKFEKKLEIFYYVISKLNKNIKIIFDCNRQDDKFRILTNFLAYNFKVHDNNYIFTYITRAFGKFNNLFDLNFYYQF